MGAIRRFHLVRLFDATGVSGVGIVAAGVLMPSGRVVLEWRTSARDALRPGALNYYESLDDMLATHGHNGMTKVVWID